MSSQALYKLEVNKAARITRHRRLFKRYSLLSLAFRKAGRFFDFFGKSTIGTIISLKHARRIASLIHFEQRENIAEVSLVNPRSIQQRIALLSITLFAVTGFMSTGLDTTFAEGDESATGGAALTYIMDQEGYFSKANPQTFDGQRIVKDKITHAVESGENISLIASHYGLKTETLLWENGLSLTSTIRIGQKLVVPPVDGISHSIRNGETLEKIAAQYKIDKSKIIAFNNINSGVVQKGQVIFLPEAKPIPEVDAPRAAVRDTPARTGSVGRLANLSTTDAKPAVGKFLIFPTIGKPTQGFKRGHYALDIGNISKPPIWAASAGTVIKANSGNWGGGYGNHVIVDHGNGVQTLYAHMDYLTVKVGQKVSQGEVIGRMGNTGRVRGVTGIHLHFEVIDHGIKRLPSLYY